MNTGITGLMEQRRREEAQQAQPSIAMQTIEQLIRDKQSDNKTAPIPTPEDAVTNSAGEETVQLEPQEPTISEQQNEIERQATLPEGWTQEDYEAVSKIYSPEQIESIFTKPDDGNLINGIYSRVYKQHTKHPDEMGIYDEKQAKRAQKYAGLIDVLSLVSRAATGAMGAINTEQKFENTATGRLSKRQKELYDRYMKAVNEYDRGEINAYLQDYQQGMKDWKETQQGIAKTLDKARTDRLTQAYRDEQLAIQQERLEITRGEAESRNTSRAINAESSRMRANATLIRANKAGSGSSSRRAGTRAQKHDYEMVLPAVPGDDQAITNELGQSVRVIGLSKGELEAYYREASKDDAFKQQYPAHFGDPTSMLYEDPKHTEVQRRDIAAAYAAEIYNRKFNQMMTTPSVDARSGAAIKTPPSDISGHQMFEEAGAQPTVKVDVPKPSEAKQTAEPAKQPGKKAEPEQPTLTQQELDEIFKIVANQ